MSTTTNNVRATPDQVWDVLTDGWLYPLWVVGATRMREVDAGWPEPGTRLHHSVGTWPVLLDDVTESLSCRPGARLELAAHAWPAGRAHVSISLRAHADGTEVVLEENATAGPGALVPRIAQDPLLSWRNVESLRRLALLAQGRAARRAGTAR